LQASTFLFSVICDRTNELASTYGVHPTQIAHWKHRLQKEMPELFSARRAKREQNQEALQAQLYQ
jgi:transposase-like protein